MPEFYAERMVQASADVVWDIISDVEGYAQAAPNLSRAAVLSGEGAGMVRRCWNNEGNAWSEECVLWEEGRRYSMVVDTANADGHPMKEMAGTWGMQEEEDGVRVYMHFEYEPKYGWLGLLLDRLLARRVARQLTEAIFDEWEAQTEAQVRRQGHSSQLWEPASHL